MGVLRHLACALVALALSSLACSSTPPREQGNLCAIFEQHPSWYAYAARAEENWGTPKHIQLAFVRHESSFRANAKPPRRWFLFVPLGRISSAKGYPQAQDPVWSEYQAERGRLFRSRSDMEDALDFIGWYNHRSHERLGLSKSNPRELYFAYHEGHAGYRRGNHKRKTRVQRVAAEVEQAASRYAAQLTTCEAKLRCRKFWQVGPLCEN